MLSKDRSPLWRIVMLTYATGTLVGCGDETSAAEEPIVRPVRYTVATIDDGGQRTAFSGVVRAGNSTRLSFQVPGRIETLSLRVGDRVTKDQPLAKVASDDYQLQLQEARASAAQARAQAQSASATYQRVRALYANQNASRQDLDGARAQRDSAQSALVAISQSVRRLQNQLEYTTLAAPEAGSISEVLVEQNEVVAAGQVIAVLQVGEQLEVAVDMPQARVTQLERGDIADVTVDTHDGRLRGEVTEIGVPTAGATVFPVTVRLPERAEGVRAGMAAEVTFAFEQADTETHIRLPLTAVGEDRAGRFVFVIDGDGDNASVKRVSVEIGDIVSDGVEVLSGVEPGQRIVTAGVSRIQDGLKVRVPDEPSHEPAVGPAAATVEGAAETAEPQDSP